VIATEPDAVPDPKSLLLLMIDARPLRRRRRGENSGESVYCGDSLLGGYSHLER
jgi:hypothetical protein